MGIEFTGRQMEVDNELRQFTGERLRKLIRLIGDQFDLHVTVTAEKHRRLAEISLKFHKQTLVGVQETTDARQAISGALDKLERQAARLLERRVTRKRRPKPTAAILVKVVERERAEKTVLDGLQTERLTIKPMTIQDAVKTLTVTPNGVVVFRNLTSERVNVIYQRPDGKLGLIEPEP
jgi:putative sigma-54 modulation protein